MSTEVNEIFLKDYKRPSFWIDTVDLDFDLFEDHSIVKTKLKVRRNIEYPKGESLCLNGVDLELLELKINGVDVNQTDYVYNDEVLTIKTDKDEFLLESVVKIHPEANESCEGLYKSASIFCTQNEAEGFRKITFFPDRPDVMAKYTTVIRADKKLYPLLLSNGNKIDSGDLDSGRHFAKWEDPFEKPCYLYALVAGDLGLVKDTFETMSGRRVDLEIYVDHGNEDKCSHAMKSLINSMKWDEEKFGLEYDLDIYMIVAVDSFNMGAMENKGLNIFNSAYVLAKKETATDSDFEGVEGVIGHEYFHNWTGNRVTCRDWFQLTLKEGLTVFRDQEFSSDMLSRSVKRIDDVKILRSHQYPEDAGPMSHPIKPKSYIEMSNFYTSTIYNKGAEVIRMVHTLIGERSFRAGMDLYFKRHDGHAVTTEDFISAMSDASGVDLDQFKMWYDQNGTPRLKVDLSYIRDTKELVISVEQQVRLNNDKYEALHIPFHFSLYDKKGERISLPSNGRFELKNKQTKISLKGIDEGYTPSWNTNFSAPVIVDFEYSDADLMFLMKYDQDDFNKYDSCQNLYKNTITKLRALKKTNEPIELDEKIISGIETILTDETLDNAFKAYAIDLPSLRDYNNELEKYDLETTDEVLDFIKISISESLRDLFITKIEELCAETKFSVDPKSMGRRALKNRLLSFIFALRDPEAESIVYDQFCQATNMTDEIGSLSILCSRENEYKDKALNSFYLKWKNETLVMQKWLSVQARSSWITQDYIRELENLEIYDKKVPNLVRSLISTFALYNPLKVNALNGEGYRFVADKILEIDAYNPQLASRIATSLNHSARLDDVRSNLLNSELKRILENKKLSKDTFEIVSKNLK